MDKSLTKKLEAIKLLERKKQLQNELPHLYGYKWYGWAWEFFNSQNRFNFLVAANQVGKSSTMIRKAIEWATNKKLWPELWRKDPLQFWYLYPTKEILTIEVKKKWVPEFLPRGKMKDHPSYGWTIEMDRKWVWAIHFNSGVSIYFKTYAQDASHLQAGSVDAIFCDEELPEHLFPELKFRLAATYGYFHMGFTATLGQEYWKQVLERTDSRRPLPNAAKQQVSMYECLKYMDGTSSHWTEAKIEEEKASCPTEAEVKRRIYGKFVKSDGLKYPSFVRSANLVEVSTPPPKDWFIYSGVDYGSGGTGGHPSAIVFVAVKPDFRSARIFKAWRGDGVQTTAGDLFQKYVSLRGELKVVAQFYDYSTRDFYEIAARNGESFIPADKKREAGEAALNTLFKHGMLVVDDVPEHEFLAREFEGLLNSTNKVNARDDGIDATRYCIMGVPWDWTAINGKAVVKKPVLIQTEAERRRDWVMGKDWDEWNSLIDEEIREWNEYYSV